MATKTDHGTKQTTDHEEIRSWAEERGGKPACVRTTQSDTSCLLRIDFPGGAGEESLRQIEWDEFFDIFEKNNLAMIYQEETAGGGTSRFSKFISRE
jgi:hypothetical protein